MRITFVSNFLNHHQLPFCLEMANRDDVNFSFIATSRTYAEQKELGYYDLNDRYPFVVRTYEGNNMKTAIDLCNESDVIMIGGNSSCETFIPNTIKKNQLVFLCSERIFKNGFLHYNSIPRFFKYFFRKKKYKNLYLLSYGKHAYLDYKFVGSFKNRTYSWAYFTKVRDNSFRKLSNAKIQILWAGRLVKWKHPEYCLFLAKHLIKKQIDFSISIIGDGKYKKTIEKRITNMHLDSNIRLLGTMNPDSVFEEMAKADVYLFTSDQGEGWGVVLNEAMMAGCAVVASDKAGATESLILSGYNGIVYKSGSKSDFLKKCDVLFSSREMIGVLGSNAYRTISEEWNAKVASDRLVSLCRSLLDGKDTPFSKGMCSKLEG